jgi:spermidine synthase
MSTGGTGEGLVPFAEISESDARTTYMIRPVWQGRTAWQDVMIAESPVYGRMLFLDGELQSASSDEHIYHESLIHPAMATVVSESGDAAALRVLVVGGGEGATVREVLRWGDAVAEVVWVDIDRELVELCEDKLGWAPGVIDDAKVTYFGEDIRMAFGRALGYFDVIVLDLPDPDGDTGYLYSDAFWNDVRAHLAVGGAVVTHCGPVRPLGNIGEGFQRVRESLGRLGDSDSGSSSSGRFYHIGIPSFQGDWGFFLWRREAEGFPSRPPVLPAGLRVVDLDQLNAWARSSKVWAEAIGATVLIET